MTETERCRKCGRLDVSHLHGKCPLDIHVIIDADSLDRVRQTGHPRLLKNLLAGVPAGAFAGIEISAITVNGELLVERRAA